MSDLKLDLDPKKIIQSLTDVSDEVKDLARQIDESLGKDSVKSIDKMKDAAEKGSSEISTYFRNLGQRVKQDLKTAFDIGGLMGGLKIAKEIGEGVKQVFDLEKAFDRLNTRLGLTGRAYQEFRNQIGRSVAKTGQKLEDIMPGVETASAKGGVKSPQDLASIGEALGKVRAATGENTETLSDSVVEILKTQGKQITGASFKSTLDALQGTRVAGSFKSAAEAGSAIQGLSPYAKQLGMDTRQMGGLAATASRGGAAGNDILKQLIEKASTPGGGTALNAIFGQKVFNTNKSGETTGINAGALGKIDMKKFGAFSQQSMASATGLQGASGADLARFVDSFKTGMGQYNKVIKGASETGNQFNVATDNLASSLDKFKERTKNAGREIGDGLSTATKAFMNKDFKGALSALKETGGSAASNKGVLGAAAALSVGGAILAGGGARSLLSKLPGGGLLGAEAAKQSGIQPVYVTNAADIGGGNGLAGAKGIAGKIGGAGLAVSGGLAAGAALANTDLGKSILNKMTPAIDKVFKVFDIGGVEKAKKDLADARAKSGSHSEMATAMVAGVKQGMVEAHKNRPTAFSHPSQINPTAGN